MAAKKGTKKAQAKAARKATKKGAARKGAQAAEPKGERRRTQSDAVVAAIKRLSKKTGSATLPQIYESATTVDAPLFATTADPKASIRCIVQRDLRVKAVEVETKEGGARREWAVRSEAEQEAERAARGGGKPAKKGATKKQAGAQQAAAPKKGRAKKAAKAASAGEEGESGAAKPKRARRARKTDSAEGGEESATGGDFTVERDPEAEQSAE